MNKETDIKNMSGKKEQRSDRSKKSDKIVDPHREYLDMDTDEEDFGRQESLEIEEEVSLEPEKPVFSEEDLDTLVNYVKCLTISSASHNVTWSENSDELIRDYFKNPSHEVLSTFYEEDTLNVVLSIPTNASKGFTYFLRTPWQIYTLDNFLSTVSFGNINENFGSCVLKFMESLYAPTVLRGDDYASFLKSDLLLNLHEFIIRLTEAIYKPMGLSALYIPKERLQVFPKSSREIDYFLLGTDQTATLSEEDEKKRKIISRLERVVWYWIRQIREAIQKASTTKTIKNIQDEVNYCYLKHSNLRHLHTQLLNPEIRFIVELLKDLRSPIANKFEKLTVHMDAILAETSSNLMYLNVLRDLYKDLNVPENADYSVKEALLLILFIWTESLFYSTSNHIESLCYALSSQIVHQCKKYVNLDIAFGSDPEMGIRKLEKCIYCCDVYKIIYKNLVTNVIPHINSVKKWNTNDSKVFDQINAFKQRCSDVIEICQAVIVFGRCNKVRLIGSVKGIDHEVYRREVEKLFHKCLNKIIVAQDIVFNVRKSVWLRKIQQFRYTVRQLENMIINLINDIFKDIRNVEEGIETIFSLQKYAKRESLRDLLQNKWIKVWTIFTNEIKSCYTDTANESMNDDIEMLPIFQYLNRQYFIMLNALDWMGFSPEHDIEKYILQQCEQVLVVIDKRRKTFNTYNTNGTH